MAELKTKPTEVAVAEFIAGLEKESQRADARQLVELMAEATGEKARMWGKSIIGFGEVHYRYASGHEGDTMKVGFSPRKTELSLYGLQGHRGSQELLAKLGKHSLGKGCVYVKRLADVEVAALSELVKNGYLQAEATLNSAGG